MRGVGGRFQGEGGGVWVWGGGGGQGGCERRTEVFVKIKKTSSPKGNDRSPESQHVIIPVANLQKATIYNTNKNLVNDAVYTKFGLILSICSQDIE